MWLWQKWNTLDELFVTNLTNYFECHYKVQTLFLSKLFFFLLGKLIKTIICYACISPPPPPPPHPPLFCFRITKICSLREQLYKYFEKTLPVVCSLVQLPGKLVVVFLQNYWNGNHTSSGLTLKKPLGKFCFTGNHPNISEEDSDVEETICHVQPTSLTCRET